MIIHPDRDALQNEIHARPRQPLATPQRVSHIALLRPARGAHEAGPDPLARLCELSGVAAPDSRDGHFFADFGAFRLKRERTAIRRTRCTATAAIRAPHSSCPPSLPGMARRCQALIAAVHVALLPARGFPTIRPAPRRPSAAAS